MSIEAARQGWIEKHRENTHLHLRTQALCRIEAKFHHLGVAKQQVEANRRYTHLHTLKHLTNQDHPAPTPSRGGSALPIAERYARGRRTPHRGI